MQEINYGEALNNSLSVLFKDAFKACLKDPAYALHFLRTIYRQRRAARQRAGWRETGLHVPPIMVISVTDRCNLNCIGCYHKAVRDFPREEMSREKLTSVIAEAKDLGISFIVLAGGEPLIRPDVLDITGAFPGVIFFIFTNGLLINEERLVQLKKQKNVIPVISMEGYENDTDGRRGDGVFRSLQPVIDRLKRNGIFWSISLTVTRPNFDAVTEKPFVQKMFDMGCKLFFFVEYTPVTEDTTEWLLTAEQRTALMAMRDRYRSEYPAIFITIPGDEEELGGCLSAGRGFVHISADGDVEPCPFAPYSDTNLREMPLREALQSDFLKSIRDNHEQLDEAEGGCALWVKREWLRSLVNKEESQS